MGRSSVWIVAFTLSAVPVRASSSGRSVTFNQQIAPIIYRNCAPCHRPGESAPFALLSYEDVRSHASQIAVVTKRRYMPPWLPEADHGDFEEERRLSDFEIELIQDWVSQGCQRGPTSKAATPPVHTTEWSLGKPDLILHVARPYELAASGQEVFWNFVIPVPVAAVRWVKAMEIRPGNARVFHHANVIIDRSGSTRRREPAPGAGFPGMGLTVGENTFDPDSHFLSWKPGSAPVVEPDGMAWRVDPGMDLVLNVHMRPSGKPETVDPVIGLYFTDRPETKFPMLVQLEHDSAIKIAPGEKDFLISDEFRCPMDLDVLAVYPHAHYLGTLLEAYAMLPDNTQKWLIRIPKWDLSWQGVFRFRQPVFLPKGTIVSMRYHYDNSSDNPRNPNNPPKLVRAGNQATDEMGHFWMQILPRGEGDQRRVLEESIARQRLVKYPADFFANYTMGSLLLSNNDASGALPFLERANRADPTSALAASALGVALLWASKLPEAEVQFRRALGLDPKYTDARYNLASAEATAGHWEAAANDFKRVLSDRPDDQKARQHLGEVLYVWGDQLAKSGDEQQAVARFRDALAYRSDDADLHASLGVALADLRRFAEAKAEFETALRINPELERARAAIAAINKATNQPQ